MLAEANLQIWTQFIFFVFGWYVGKFWCIFENGIIIIRSFNLARSVDVSWFQFEKPLHFLLFPGATMTYISPGGSPTTIQRLTSADTVVVCLGCFVSVSTDQFLFTRTILLS